LVRPNCGFLDSEETILIEILLKHFNPQENKIEYNKFIVEFAPKNQNSSSKIDPDSFWNDVDKKLIFGYKLKVSVIEK
jgi:hypothetical protein